MALKDLKRPKTEFLNQSSEIESPAISDVESLSDDERTFFFERAAIMEYDGGMSREEAEKQALEIVMHLRAANDGTVAKVKWFLTNADKADLRNLGYTDVEIRVMRPDEGAAIIAANKIKEVSDCEI